VLVPAIRNAGGYVRWSDVVIHHTGYQDLALRRRKLERDWRLLQIENTEKPYDSFILFNLASVAMELGKAAEALTFLQRSLARSNAADSIVRKLYAMLAQCHRQLGQYAEALAACQDGRSLYPDDVELLFQEAVVHRESGDARQAESCWLQLLERREGSHFASVDLGLQGYKTRYNLGLMYLEQGRFAESEAQWNAALAENREFFPACIGLGETYCAQAPWSELEQVCGRLASEFDKPVEAAVLRARGHLGRKEYQQGRALVQETIAANPQALWPRVVLSHIFLQEGKDWTAAETALREVLRLEPNHAEAKRNLSILVHQRNQQAAG
jgi:tetratricopeptide (TPR) repeat protein